MPKKNRKNKYLQFGKSLLLPTVSLVTLFIGAGSAVTVATTSTLLGTSTETNVETDTQSPALADFCADHWGDLIDHGRYCRFEQWYHLNLKHAGADPVLTGMPLLPGDTLRLESSRFPEAVVGGVAYDASEEHIVVRAPGYLSFRAVRGQLYFSVERLGLERCFADKGGAIETVACPE